jgi:hypothetical protein
VAVFLSCVVEQTKELAVLRDWGLRLDMLYSEADGRNPAVNAVYRVLAICMFGIGLYEIKVPLLNERVKVSHRLASLRASRPVPIPLDARTMISLCLAAPTS